MTTKYADRAFLTINGAKLADLQSASLKQNRNAKAVNSMTNDGYNRGFVQGNVDVDVSFTLALQNTLSRPKLETINYETNDVNLHFDAGAERFIVTGLFLKDNEDNAGGVGDEVKSSFNMGALKVTDSIGNSSLFDVTTLGPSPGDSTFS